MTTLLQAWLVAWLFALGLSLGALANLMVLALTGGRWAAAVRGPWRAAASALPWIALGFIPVALGLDVLYPWHDAPGRWLNAPFFIGRGIADLVVWSVIAWGFLRADARDPRGHAARAWSAAGLIVYGVTMSIAAVDWIVSLTPGWYSSGFGLEVVAGQMLAAAAFAIAIAGFTEPGMPTPERRRAFHDMGNLLLMYVLTWAYLAYTQFVVIWSEDIPRETAWYVPRLQTGWSALGMAIVALHFVLPFAILLSRRAKRAPRLLASLASVLLVAHFLHVYWMVVPSLRAQGLSLSPMELLAFAAAAVLWTIAWRRARRLEPRHA